MKYLEILNKDKETVATENNSLVNDEANISIQTAIVNVKKSIQTNKTLQATLLNKVPVSFDSLYEAEVEGKVLAKRLEWLEAKQKELF